MNLKEKHKHLSLEKVCSPVPQERSYHLPLCVMAMWIVQVMNPQMNSTVTVPPYMYPLANANLLKIKTKQCVHHCTTKVCKVLSEIWPI